MFKSKERVALIGCDGMIGRELLDYIPTEYFDVIPLSHKGIEISNFESVSSVIKRIKPDIIINAAGLANVQECENNEFKSYLLNVVGPINLSIISNIAKCRLFHFSTNYVFNGETKTPYFESDTPCPVNIYGKTKLYSELAIKEYCKMPYHIIRISLPYSKYPNRSKGTNFVLDMIDKIDRGESLYYSKGFISTPTLASDIAKAVVEIMVSEDKGIQIYHIANKGECSLYQFAEKVISLLGVNNELDSFNLNPTVRFPMYSSLGCSYVVLQSWEDAITKFITEHKRNLVSQ